MLLCTVMSQLRIGELAFKFHFRAAAMIDQIFKSHASRLLSMFQLRVCLAKEHGQKLSRTGRKTNNPKVGAQTRPGTVGRTGTSLQQKTRGVVGRNPGAIGLGAGSSFLSLGRAIGHIRNGSTLVNQRNSFRASPSQISESHQKMFL